MILLSIFNKRDTAIIQPSIGIWRFSLDRLRSVMCRSNTERSDINASNIKQHGVCCSKGFVTRLISTTYSCCHHVSCLVICLLKTRGHVDLNMRELRRTLWKSSYTTHAYLYWIVCMLIISDIVIRNYVLPLHKYHILKFFLIFKGQLTSLKLNVICFVS